MFRVPPMCVGRRIPHQKFQNIMSHDIGPCIRLFWQATNGEAFVTANGHKRLTLNKAALGYFKGLITREAVDLDVDATKALPLPSTPGGFCFG